MSVIYSGDKRSRGRPRASVDDKNEQNVEGDAYMVTEVDKKQKVNVGGRPSKTPYERLSNQAKLFKQTLDTKLDVLKDADTNELKIKTALSSTIREVFDEDIITGEELVEYYRDIKQSIHRAEFNSRELLDKKIADADFSMEEKKKLGPLRRITDIDELEQKTMFYEHVVFALKTYTKLRKMALNANDILLQTILQKEQEAHYSKSATKEIDDPETQCFDGDGNDEL
tara:strand:- start:221 stop:901 length:681 start_codon:yes stop_codon:yes gene_type:complete